MSKFYYVPILLHFCLKMHDKIGSLSFFLNDIIWLLNSLFWILFWNGWYVDEPPVSMEGFVDWISSKWGEGWGVLYFFFLSSLFCLPVFKWQMFTFACTLLRLWFRHFSYIYICMYVCMYCFLLPIKKKLTVKIKSIDSHQEWESDLLQFECNSQDKGILKRVWIVFFLIAYQKNFDC